MIITTDNITIRERDITALSKALNRDVDDLSKRIGFIQKDQDLMDKIRSSKRPDEIKSLYSRTFRGTEERAHAENRWHDIMIPIINSCEGVKSARKAYAQTREDSRERIVAADKWTDLANTEIELVKACNKFSGNIEEKRALKALALFLRVKNTDIKL